MKKLVLFFIVLFAYQQKVIAQGSISYTLKWNSSQTRYEVYARPNFSQNSFSWGTSQVGIVTPAIAPDNLVIASAMVTGWSLGQTFRLAPTAQPQNDFFGITTNGSAVNLVANTEILLFTFTFIGGQCFDGVRLFVNGSDPSSGAAGMSGGDFRNYVYNDEAIQFYTVNYNNTGTSCSACNVVAPELSKQ